MIVEDAFEFSNTAAATDIAKFIVSHRCRIYEVWRAVIRRRSTRGGDHILDTLQREYESDTDLLTLFGYTLTGQIHAETSRLHGLVEKVRTKEYSVSELFYEIFSLQDAFEATFGEAGFNGNSDTTANLNMTRRVLGRIFSTVLEQTSWIYEHVTESGKRGFCQMDRDGRIIYCNSEMERIFEGRDVKGERLENLFPELQQNYIRESISGKCGASLGSRELEFPNADGVATTVWAEIEPVFYEKEFIGSYAMLTDISPVARRETVIFDSSPWCVVKTDILGHITYANPEAMALFGVASLQGRLITEFVKGEDREILINALKRRRRGESGTYRLTVTPIGDSSRQVEIDICGVPVTDADGAAIGSVGIFHSRDIDNTSHAIHTQIAEKHDPKEMLEAVSKIVSELIPFDLCVVTRFCKSDNQDIVHYNPYFTDNLGQEIYWKKKWTPMSDAMVRWMRREKVEPYILKTFLRLDEWKELADDPDVRELQNQGFKSFIFRVVGNGVPESSFALLSKDEQAFDDRACEILEKLPLDQVMMMARHQLDIREIKFRFELIKLIARAPSLASAAERFVRRLQQHYEWLHVSLFRVERYREMLVLQAQTCSNESMLLEDGYSQPFDKGMLGVCFASGEMLNVGDVSKHDLFKQGIQDNEGHMPTRSELCYPIRAEGEIRWVLNIEATQLNAFSSEEESSVSQACDEFGLLIERLSRHFSFQACFDSTTDPVIITDNADNIMRANPSAKSLLLGDNAHAAGSLKSYFKDQNQAQALLNESRSAPTEVTLQKCRDNGQGVDMLMSCCVLPEEFGEKVYISKDLSRLRRMEELKYLSQLSYEVAAQSQTSLSLAFTWLRRLRDDADPQNNIPELADKIIHQLRKVQATYDRMAFYDGDASLESEQPIRLNLATEIERLLDDFPESDRAMVSVPDQAGVPYIMADPVHIGFVLESLFSYLLRYASRDRKIEIGIQNISKHLELTITGCEPVREVADDLQERFLARMRTDIAIGRRMLDSFIKSQHGKLFKTERQNGLIIFRMEFPIHEMEDVA